MPRPIFRSVQKLLNVGKSDKPINLCNTVGLYFAENSTACSQSTLEIIALEEKLRQRSKEFQIIVISKDENKESFDKLSSEVPWMIIPFTSITHRVRLHRIFRVCTVPSLIIVEWPSGHVICWDVMRRMQKDPDGLSFPWQPRPIVDILRQAQIKNSDGTPFNYQNQEEAYKALYFSASWCPPCKAFTPQLITTYEKLKNEGKSFEVIFVSSDRTQDCFNNYHRSMPWPAIEWTDEDSRRNLAEALQIRGIPALVLLNPDLSVISTHGRSILKEDPMAKRFPWPLSSIEVFLESHLPVLMERPCLVLLMDDESDTMETGMELLSATAEEYFAQYPNEPPFLAFFIVEESEASERLREIANFEDVVPLLAILDVCEGLKYQMEDDTELSPKTVHNFLTRYIKDEIVPLSLEGPPIQLSSPGS